MAVDKSFNCPKCGALYQLVKVEGGPETTDREITCRVCGAQLPSHDGKLFCKYFLLREAARRQRWKRAETTAGIYLRHN